MPTCISRPDAGGLRSGDTCLRDDSRDDSRHHHGSKRWIDERRSHDDCRTTRSGPGSWTRAQIDDVSSGWWVLLVTGIISILAGGIILLADWTVSDLVAFVGAVLVFHGIFMMFSVPVDGAARGWAVALGLLEAALRRRGLGLARAVTWRPRRVHRLLRALQRHHDHRRRDQWPVDDPPLGIDAGTRESSRRCSPSGCWRSPG